MTINLDYALVSKVKAGALELEYGLVFLLFIIGTEVLS
jgi:hypothetical protein